MKLLVTGATGQLGSLVAEELLKRVPAERIAVSVRDPKKAEHLAARGVEVRQADFNDYDSVVKAFTGADRVLIISTNDLANRNTQHLNAVNAAKAAGVRLIAYTSAPNADRSKLALAESHKFTEEAIRKSGVPYAIFRNNWYLENEMGTFQAVLNGAPWTIASGQGRVGWALRRDYAEAAARVLAGEGHENKVYELGGKLRTQEELSQIFAKVTGRSVQVQYADEAAYAKILQQAGMPEPVAAFFARTQTQIGEGALEVDGSDLDRLLGREPTPLEDGIRLLLS